ncbi:hypothetical protein ACHAWF_009469 [Thalassiosira exigua]
MTLALELLELLEVLEALELEPREGRAPATRAAATTRRPGAIFMVIDGIVVCLFACKMLLIYYEVLRRIACDAPLFGASRWMRRRTSSDAALAPGGRSRASAHLLLRMARCRQGVRSHSLGLDTYLRNPTYSLSIHCNLSSGQTHPGHSFNSVDSEVDCVGVKRHIRYYVR